MKVVLIAVVLLLSCVCVAAQDSAAERRVSLSEKAVALNGSGSPALEATLRTTALNGAEDSPVTNISLVVRNISGTPYTYVNGLVTFYDGAGVRCGEGLFKAGSLSVDEAFETDTPGIRIRCSPSSWRIVANNLLPRVPPLAMQTQSSSSRMNLVISLNGEEHPIQLDKPMVLKVGDAERTIVVREAP
ncbi:MAG TPA: hypothetical protein VLL54_21110 [Pyrinomonadaceae bacterium]|nr:hypothetical protein [Pyrinomonadaceae bacterium]